MTRSNQVKSYSPGLGSTLAQDKIPAVTGETPASFIAEGDSGRAQAPPGVDRY